MDVIDERELKNFLRGRPPANLMIATVLGKVLDPASTWEERRPYWHYLMATGRASTVAAALAEGLKLKIRIPFDLLIEVAAEAGLKPKDLVVQALTKGLRKQHAQEEVLGARAWDAFEPKLAEMRARLFEHRRELQREYKDGLLEKFEFLENQRMYDQAGRVLRRMLELYPEEPKYRTLKARFQEERAREVLTGRRIRAREKFERTETLPSTSDQEMLKCFLEEGVKVVMDKRDVAPALSVALWFLDDYAGAGEALRWAEPSAAVDWMRAEVLFAGRRFLECLDLVGTLEIKYVNDPETTFAVSYLRAQCLRELGQPGPALETLQSIVRIRPNYRSATQLIHEWQEGTDWE